MPATFGGFTRSGAAAPETLNTRMPASSAHGARRSTTGAGNSLDNVGAGHEDATLDETGDAVRTATLDRAIVTIPIGRRAGIRPP